MFLKFPFPFTVCLFYNDNINIIIFFPQCIFSPLLSSPQFDNDLMSSLIARLEQVVEKQKLVCLLALEKNHCSLFGAWHALSSVIVSSATLLPSTAQLQFWATLFITSCIMLMVSDMRTLFSHGTLPKNMPHNLCNQLLNDVQIVDKKERERFNKE